MKRSTIWGLSLTTLVVSGAVAASTVAPAFTRADVEENEVVYVLDPESGAYVNDLQSVSISFPDIKGVQVNDEITDAIVLTKKETGEKYICEYPDRADRSPQGTEFILKFASSEVAEGEAPIVGPITTPGTYELIIKEGTFYYGNEQDTGEDVTITDITNVEAINATYTVVEAAPAVAYTLDPEDGAIVNDLQTITISFEDKNVQPNDRMELSAIVLTAENGDEYYCDAPVRDPRATQGVAYTLNFLTTVETEAGMENNLLPITEPGTYTLSIMKGTFIRADEVEGEDGVTLENIVPVEAINATYSVVEAAPAVAYTLDPEDGAIVNDLQIITISFEDRTVQPNDRMEFNAIVLTDENGEEYYCDAPVRDVRAAQGVAYKLNFLTSTETEDGVENNLLPITKPGTYKLTILKNTFIKADEVEDAEGNVILENIVPVEAINATYTVAEAAPAVAYTLDPEDGAIVNDLQTITISFEDRTVQPNDRMEFNAIVLTDENGEEYYCDAPVRDVRAAQGVAYKLNFLTSVETENGVESTLKPITAPGTYKLSILKNTFIKADEVEDAEGNVTLENIVPVEAINATYTVAEAAPAVTYTLDPEDGAIVNDIQTITISFEDRTVQPNDRMEFNAIVLTDENGEEYYCDAPVRDVRAAQGVAYKLNFLTSVETENGVEEQLLPITAPGTYKLTILKNTFIKADEVEDAEGNVTLENIVPVEAINATYTVAEAAPAVAYTLDPEDGAIVNDIQTITISFEDRTVQPNDRMEFNAIVLTDENGEEYYCDAPVRDVRAAEGVAYKLNFLTSVETENGVEEQLLPITAPGTYKLSILKNTFIKADEVEDAEGNVTLDNIVPVEAINATYTVAEAAPSVAYTLDPEDGAIVNDLQTITISFEDRTVQPNDRMEFNAIVLTADNGEEYYCDAPVRDVRAAQGVAYTLNFLTSVETENGVEEQLLPITAPGTYKLSILKNTFIKADEVEDAEGNVTLENIVPVEAINATYTVAEAAPAVAYTLDPEDGAIVNDLQTITISFEDRNVQPNDRMEFNAIVLTDENGEEYYCDAPVRDVRAAQGVAYTLNFLTSVETENGVEEQLLPITAPGTYKLSILKNTFIKADEVEDAEGNVTLENVVPVEAINATYTVVEAAPAIAYTLDPEDGAYVNDLQTITISFDDMNVQPNDRMEFSAIVLTADNGEEYYCDAPVRDDRAAEGVAYTLNFLTSVETENGVEEQLLPITEPGTYTLSIQKGAFIRADEVEGEDGVTLENIISVQAITATYIIAEPLPQVAYVLDPEDGAYVNDLQAVNISFPENKAIQFNERMPLPFVLKNVGTGEEYICEYPERDDRAEQGTAFTLHFISVDVDPESEDYAIAPITAPGTYELSIKQGAFIYGDEVVDAEGNVTLENIIPVQAIEATYIITTTGVNAIFGADTTEFNVYGVNGLQILKAADGNAVNALPSGLYIINGKKVIKK